MNILIFTAQPNTQGFTHQIAKQYEGTVKTKGHTVEIIDLYEDAYQLPFLSFQEDGSLFPNQTRIALQEKIAMADRLVFVFPMWWGEYPAIVKNMIDNVYTAGFAFTFEKNGMPKGLLAEKIAEVYMTCDAPRWTLFLFGFPFKKLFTQKILGFCGIKTTRFHLFGSAKDLTTDKKSKILQKITAIALS